MDAEKDIIGQDSADIVGNETKYELNYFSFTYILILIIGLAV